ncbi:MULTISPECIES: LacI family DNA-binding transcriptional regulator [unclassified Streptomyces]|uniref:LacI family DNA-binding transcriptional regulator n=1 Tax=unclassified Streptomyces TaxID=2593676 RepID=UPI002E789FB0|nr:LacI family DNA-binding transcriptional regulator [Streptomyces sp. JV176]MEE1801280.1 LacI family DNA-binding transcriptional regulator [Streptomyces sp. JV176]
MKRPTMADIADRAGVTKAAVSFALNDRPGVSEPTRRRIRAIAQELGWQPNSAARALSGGTAGAFGLVIDRPAHTLGLEPFFMQLISGIQAELIADATPLVFTMAEDRTTEIALYRSWSARRRVDGVFLVDLKVDDARVPVLEELGLPTVVIGAPVGTRRLPAVWSDDAAAVTTVVRHLAGLGHRRLARVGGPAPLRHTAIRTAAFDAAVLDLGLTGRTVEADYSGEGGAAATRALLGADRPPTAILYDNDVMAVSGLTAAHSLGVRVPADLSLVAWDDSALCELVDPPLTALSRDIVAHGARAARMLREVAGGLAVRDLQDPAPRLTVRGSVGPPPATDG